MRLHEVHADPRILRPWFSCAEVWQQDRARLAGPTATGAQGQGRLTRHIHPIFGNPGFLRKAGVRTYAFRLIDSGIQSVLELQSANILVRERTLRYGSDVRVE